MADPLRIVVVGAGIIGASIAWHLVRAGTHVTVVEAGEPGGVATRNSLAWINASWGNREPYYCLRVQAMADRRRLEVEVPGVKLVWSGGLIWDLPPDRLEAFAAEHASWGYDIRRVDRARVRVIEPRLANPPELALHAPGEGAVEPALAAQILLSAAQGLGAAIQANKRVRSLRLDAGRIVGVDTDTGFLPADRVVIAAGAETGVLVATAGLPLPITAPPALLIATRPHARILNGLVMAPELHLRQAADGRIVASAGFDGGDPADEAPAAAALFDALKGMIDGGASLALASHAIGRRPIPADGLPAVGAVDGIAGLHVAVMHSGITLAPVIGRLVADEIVNDRCHPLLEPYNPGRFAGAAKLHPNGA